ncbi:hypothetical protein DCAR_0207667 [Daucus carota subsp. sativus]|uniref:Uncharacterized protein n=1 Tax=Daucus carota subsp. sativus TaxID=79200 RepID=A0AAF0WEF1_DAUCS|nr:PREDICTED: uncharacterized protein LOC108210272 [Daucus carota subsp. sativus]WOG88432.1 hypothetical protein DCAR_0207667 [Daucus carota subsp. sativus]
MAITLSLGLSFSGAGVTTYRKTSAFPKPTSYTTKIRCIGWDPEGVLGPPSTGHIARREFQQRLQKDAGAREDFKRQILEEQERLRNLRAARVVPDTPAGLIEYFLDTEAQELEFEIARLRPRLDDEFFACVKFELGQLRFAVNKTQDMEDRVLELEALQKALQEGTEAYDKLQTNIVKARERLTKILTSKDIKATLLEMLERNELNKSLLTLLDENIASAQRSNQKEAADFMEKLRGAMLKYITV